MNEGSVDWLMQDIQLFNRLH